MPLKRIVTGQPVKSQQQARAVELRHRMTPAETTLWQHLRANRMQGIHFRRQQVIGRFIIDFYCHQAGLVVEVDGGIHLKQAEYDHERDLYLQECGLQVLHFTNLEVKHELERVLSAIIEACRSGYGKNDLPRPLPEGRGGNCTSIWQYRMF